MVEWLSATQYQADRKQIKMLGKGWGEGGGGGRHQGAPCGVVERRQQGVPLARVRLLQVDARRQGLANHHLSVGQRRHLQPPSAAVNCAVCSIGGPHPDKAMQFRKPLAWYPRRVRGVLRSDCQAHVVRQCEQPQIATQQ